MNIIIILSCADILIEGTALSVHEETAILSHIDFLAEML
jgi:hypothetical protein